MTSVEEKLCEHLERLGLGLPLPNVPTTVADVVRELTTFQGGFLEGLLEIDDALTPVIKSIVDTVRNPKVSKKQSIRLDSDKQAPVEHPTTINARLRQQPKPRLFTQITALASAHKLISRDNSSSVLPTTSNTTHIVTFADAKATI